MTKILVASNNKNKIREIKQILGDIFEPVSLSEAGIISEPEETGATFLENALIKAKAGVKASGLPCIADDSGLCVYALSGEPGVYSARYSGNGATDGKNNEKLLNKMINIIDRKAYFKSAVALVFPDGKEIIAEGTCEGIILYSGRGTNGFGYDPLFYVEEYQKTFAELDGSVKNVISHRANALKELRRKIK